MVEPSVYLFLSVWLYWLSSVVCESQVWPGLCTGAGLFCSAACVPRLIEAFQLLSMGSFKRVCPFSDAVSSGPCSDSLMQRIFRIKGVRLEDAENAESSNL